jgi:hypothetical protein
VKSVLYELQVERERENAGAVGVGALKDLENKLKESVRENEGLKREIQLLLLVRKNHQ